MRISNWRIVAVVGVFVASSVVAEDHNPPPPQQPPADTASALRPADPGVRKLSRRERKDRIQKLSDTYREFLRDVEPIMMPNELDAFLVLETDAQRDVFIDDFWKRRDQAQGTTNRAFKTLYYDRLEAAKERFRQVSSDRSRIFLLHGEPESTLKVECDRLLQPIEIWKYAYVPGIGHDVRLLFYIPRQSNDYKLWNPQGELKQSMSELISVEAMALSMGGDEAAVRKVFQESASPYVYINKIEAECKQGDEILRAIYQTDSNKTVLAKVYDPPPINEEDVGKLLRAVVLATPNAPKLVAEFSVRYPAKQGARTDAEMTVLVPRSQLAIKEVGGSNVYSLDVVGEVLRNEQMYENYRYRFDYPGDIKDEKVPVVIDRFLRPNDYRSRIKVVDVNSGAEAILENDLKVPEIFDTAEDLAKKSAGATTVKELKDAVDSNEARLRIVPLADELLSGIQKIETIAVGSAIKAVEFYLDGKKIAVKRQPPFTLDLDFGSVPQVRRIRAIALDHKNEAITGDDIVVNTGTDPFRVRIASPRVATKIKGKTRVEIDVRVPDGKKLEAVELYWNETRVATMYDPPFVQSVIIPEVEGVGYLRAVAKLKDDPTPPIEDVVMVNTPQFMEEINVHLVELPTTVLQNGKPLNDLAEASFKVFDEGKPVKIAKFEHVKNLPLAIGMAVDTSGSMLLRMSETQKAGAEFFKNVMKAGDKAFLVAFDSQPQIVQKWSPQVGDMHAGLAKLRAEDYTALYDAVVFSLYNFLGVRGQKALVILSDGKDTASKFSYDQAVEYAKRAAVPIYTIGIGIRATEIDVKYKLNQLCRETGGNAYYIEGVNELARIYNDIQNELRSQYVLGFYPPEGVKPGGKWREVTVQAAEGKAKTIRGYYP